MKTTISFLYLFLLLLMDAYSQNLWQKSYDFNNGNTDLCFKIIETTQQNYVLCGATTIPSQFSYGFDGIVLSLNQYGDTIWSKKLGSMGYGAQNDFLFDVIENSNNELILTGARKQGTQKQQLWIVKILLSTNGTQILNIVEKQIGLSNKDDGGAKIIQNPDGTYFVVGFTESYGTQQGGKDAWLLKLDQNLDTLWTKTYDYGYSDEGAAIIPFHNGYLLVINSITGHINFPVPYYTSFSNIVYIDNNGNIQKQITFNTNTINSFSKIEPTNDGGAILVGSTSMYDNDFGGRDIFIVKLDANADTIWTKIYGGYGKYDGGNAIVQSNDGTYYLAAYSQTLYTDSVDNWWLMRLNESGDTLYTKWLITRTDNDDPVSMFFSSDGALVVAGWINANSNPANGWNMGNADICVVKMDANFNITDIKTEYINTYGYCNIFPNPFKDQTIIETAIPFNNTDIYIYDIYGNEIKVLKKISGTNNVIIKRENMISGLYFLQIRQDNKIIATKKIFMLD